MEDINEAIQSIVEDLSSLEDADVTMEEVYEILMNYAQTPMNINAASETELLQLHILNEFQASSIVEYIRQYGEMQTPYELQYVQGITQELMEKLFPFVTTSTVRFAKKTSLKQLLLQGRHQTIGRVRQTLETQQGYTPISEEDYEKSPNSRYLGSPQSIYLRHRYTYRDKLQWNITMEKDAGESFGAPWNKYGFDYYSGHIKVSNIGKIHALVAGDFYVQLGQGLLLWQGASFNKTSDALAIAKRGAGIKAYSGVNENLFFRGVGANVRITDRVIATGFVSYKNLDASVDSLGVFSSLQTTGLHSTPREVAGKNTVGEMVVGGSVAYNWTKFRLGVNALHHRFGGDYQKNVQLYNLFELNKNTNTNISADYRWYIKKVYLFGEFGVSENGALAVLNGCLADVASRLQLAVLHRYYEKDYQAYYANAFSEGGRAANENGIYIGANLFLHPKVKTSLYFDVYDFPWLKFRANAPSKGFDVLMQTEYTPQSFCKMQWRLRYETKEENISNDELQTKQIGEKEKFALRYSIQYNLFEGLSCESRVEGSLYSIDRKETTNGIMVFQDASYKLKKLPFKIGVRYAFFSTDDYNTRIYAYESDVLYAFSVPAYYGQGSRWYVNLQWNPMERLVVWLRCAQTFYFDRESIGDGLTKIDGNHRTDMKLQMQWKF
ncbi:MAG: ComEA family DNA-binding protein [Bacteroidales bacterium]